MSSPRVLYICYGPAEEVKPGIIRTLVCEQEPTAKNADYIPVVDYEVYIELQYLRNQLKLLSQSGNLNE